LNYIIYVTKGGIVIPKIALIGSLDTKGEEYAYLKTCVEDNGYEALLIDVGVLDPPRIVPDVTREEAAAAANIDLAELAAAQDRGQAVAAMGCAAEAVLVKLYGDGQIAGVIALGGTGGTSVACQGMRALPIGFPKLMVSTVAGSDVSAYTGGKDIVMYPSIVDIAGINQISGTILSRAAGAICGMCKAGIPKLDSKPLIAASMFGNTTKAVEEARRLLEEAGYEVLVFHATGGGGRTMEALIASGMIAGVLDLTTTEWADELIGGVFAAGPDRLSAAASSGVPAVVAPGCLDMVNFWAPETVPKRFEGRLFYPHNPNVTLMRTNLEENHKLGQLIAEKLNQSTGPVTVLLPRRGISVISEEGGAFHWPEADAVLFETLKAKLRKDIPVIEMDNTINDPAFAARSAEALIASININIKQESE
jgi:uncharacterized protein (UPF0261 family)